MGKNVHVLPYGDHWAVKTEKSEKLFRVAEKRKVAFDMARQVVKNQKSKLIVHKKNGEIGQNDSFGNDTRIIKG